MFLEPCYGQGRILIYLYVCMNKMEKNPKKNHTNGTIPFFFRKITETVKVTYMTVHYLSLVQALQ